MIRRILAPWLLLITGMSVAHGAVLQGASCDPSLVQAIPLRTADALSGSQFRESLHGLDADAREQAIRSQLLAGNLPKFMRRLQPIELDGISSRGEPLRIVLCVMPDYLVVGSDDDFMLAPLRLNTALKIAERLGFLLPTTAIVDAIHRESTYQLIPQPLPASPEMRSSAYFYTHDALIRSQRDQVAAVPGELISGHKKDLVLSQRLWDHTDRIAIYGWQEPKGHVIQPLSTVHGWHYVDYSHGARLVSDHIWVNGLARSLARALQDADIAKVLNYEGVIPHLEDLLRLLSQSRTSGLTANLQGDAGATLLQQRKPR